MKIDKKTLMPVVVLMSICLVVALLLAGVNMLTADRIKKANADKINQSFSIVMPDGEFNDTPDTLKEGAPETVKAVYTEKNGKGHIVLLTTNKGYTGKNISITVAIDTAGKIINAVITENGESIVPNELKPMGTYGEKYKGVDANGIDGLSTGATVKFTENAIKNAIKDAFLYLGYLEPSAPPPTVTTDDYLDIAGDLISGSQGFTKKTLSGQPNTVVAVYEENSGKGSVVFLTTNKGYTGKNISIAVAIDTTGKIINSVITENEESIVPEALKPMGSYGEAYKNVDANGIDSLVTGATVVFTESAIKGAIKDAFKYLGFLDATPPAGDDAEILAIAATMVQGNSGFTKVELSGEYENLVAVYKENGDKGYLAHTLVVSGYGTTETETLIFVNMAGVIESVYKKVWKTSDAMHGYVPPTSDVVDVFYQGIVGKSSATVESLSSAPVSNATSTTGKLIASLKEALLAVDGIIAKEMPTSEATVLSLAAALVGGTPDFERLEIGETDYLRRLYRNKTDGSYVAYVVVISQYGTPETETLIHIRSVEGNGEIIAVKKITWKTSDAMHGYVPPTSDTVDAFYAGIAGKTASTIESLSSTPVSNATSTTGRLIASIKEALLVTDTFIAKDISNAEEAFLSLAATLVGGNPDFERMEIGENEYLKRLYKNKADGSYVAYVIVISQYGTPETETIIHIGPNGAILGIKKLIWKTSDAMHGYVPPTADVVDAFYAKIIGKTASTIESLSSTPVSGATSTTGRLIASIKEALLVTNTFIARDMPTSDATVLSLAATLVGGNPDFERLEIGENEYLRRLYRNKRDGSYVAYVVVISQYGTPETETLIHIGRDARIKKVAKITWKTSDEKYGYVPPTADVVDVFYSKIAGNNSFSIDSLASTPVSNATSTTGRLIASIKEALVAVDGIVAKDELSESTLLSLAATLVGGNPDFESVEIGETEYLKKLYRNKADGSYVAYVVVLSQYGTAETEALLHIGENGRIIAAERIVWKTSDAIYGYVPPTLAEADKLYEQLVGKNYNSVAGVDLVSNATNTSTNLLNSVKEALKTVEDLEGCYLPRIIGIVIISVSLICGVALTVILRKRRKPYEK